MYRLIKSNGDIIYVAKPRYVRRNSAGIWSQCDAATAECISVYGNRYSIHGKTPIDDAPEFLIVNEVDSGEVLQNIHDRLKAVDSIEEIKKSIVDCYGCILDLYERTD